MLRIRSTEGHLQVISGQPAAPAPRVVAHTENDWRFFMHVPEIGSLVFNTYTPIGNTRSKLQLVPCVSILRINKNQGTNFNAVPNVPTALRMLIIWNKNAYSQK